MVDPLEPLLADGVIDEVVSRLKSGKEADLYLVRHGQEVVAAKVYKARETRSFKNNSAYLEGRRTRNSRTQRAMDKGSRFGQAAAEEAWKTKEADALHALHAAGVRVPRPVLFYEGVLLMEVVVDAAGHPAPRLIDAEIPKEQAAALYADLRGQVVKMLCCDLVHGDLSPYNVLLGWEGPVVIDFPQVVGAAHNSQAEGFFFRDLANLRHFFEAIDPAIKASAGDGREIWRAYTRRELAPDFVPSPLRPGATPQVDPRELPPGERPPPPQRQQRPGQPQRGAQGPGRPQASQPHPGQPHPVRPQHRQSRPQDPAGSQHRRGQPRQAGPERPAQPQPPPRPAQPQRPAEPPRPPHLPPARPQQQPPRPHQPGNQPQQQRPGNQPQQARQPQPARTQQPQQARQPQPPRTQQPQQQRPPRQPGRGGQQPRGPIVERRPVLGGVPSAPASNLPPVKASPSPPESGVPSSPGQGKRRRRRRGGRGGGGGGGGGGSSPG
jgi:RIO kinase 1